jgi:hypothetical protein
MAIIKLKRSETAAAQPASLEYGEVAINVTDKKIYIGNSSGATTLIVDGNAGGAVSSFNTRTGAITLTSSDVTTALGFTPISGVSTEIIQDAAASLFTSGTHTGISVSYPDTNNAINLTNTGVLSFNTRTGSVTLTSGDVTTALGFTPTTYTAPILGSTTLTSGTTITTVAGLTSVTSTSFVGALTGNASTVTNGVYTTDTATVTNTMLAGSIANNKLTNSSVTVNGSSISLGGSATVTANTTNALTIGTGLSGTSFNGSSAVTVAIDSTVATLTGGQTLTNKTISGSSNTLSNIANASLTNSSITVNGSSISLGGSATVTATATNTLTLGTGLTGTSYNGSTAVTAAVDTSTIATKSYVDSVAQGLHAHSTVKTATTTTLASLTGTTVSYSGGAITWTGGNAATGASFNDGTTLTANNSEALADKILVKNEASGLGAAYNGVYYVYAARELRRSSDGDVAADWAGGDFVFVTDGTTYDNTGWVQTNKVTTLDTDPIAFQQFSGAGTFTADETTLTLSGNVFSIKSTYVGQTSITTLGTVATGTWNATAIGATKGGTGQTTYAVGDLLYASTTSALSKLTIGANNYVLTSDGTNPVWTANTGTGSVVRASSPTLVTPTLGVASATSINKVAFTAPATSATLTIADGKTLTASNTLTFTGTDSSSVAFGAGGTVAYTSNKLSVFAATSSSELAGVISDETGSGALVFGTSPAFTTSVTTGSTSFDAFNTTATTLNIGGACSTALNLAVAASGNRTVNIGTGAAGNRTINLANDIAGIRTVNILAKTSFVEDYASIGGAVIANICDGVDTDNNFSEIYIGSNAIGSANLGTVDVYIGSNGLGGTNVYNVLTAYGDIVVSDYTNNLRDSMVFRARTGGVNGYAVIVQPTTLSATRTLTLPNTTGTVITTGDTGTVTNTMLAGSIANNKLTNSAITINSSSTSLGGSVTLYLGTTTLQTSSTNQAITGISSIAFSDGTTQTTGASSGADYLLFAMGII